MDFNSSVFQELQDAYLEKTIPMYFERHNSGKGRSMSLGILWRRNYGIGFSRLQDKYAGIWTAARNLAAKICPDLDWTCLAVNFNYQAEPHIDKNNDGVSCVVGFGDYEGGELVLTKTGEEINIRHRPYFFKAAETQHHVKPITSGTRLSIVFFRPRYTEKFRAKYGKPSLDEMIQMMPTPEDGKGWSSVALPC
jgi:hypothetical protein